jgi:hypothetical protein
MVTCPSVSGFVPSQMPFVLTTKQFPYLLAIVKGYGHGMNSDDVQQSAPRLASYRCPSPVQKAAQRWGESPSCHGSTRRGFGARCKHGLECSPEISRSPTSATTNEPSRTPRNSRAKAVRWPVVLKVRLAPPLACCEVIQWSRARQYTPQTWAKRVSHSGCLCQSNSTGLLDPPRHRPPHEQPDSLADGESADQLKGSIDGPLQSSGWASAFPVMSPSPVNFRLQADLKSPCIH